MKKKICCILLTTFIAIISPFVVIFRIMLWSAVKNHFDGFATIISAGVVIAIYYIEQNSKKVNAAKLVIKEIDATVLVAKGIEKTNRYDQKTICVATDSWSNSIHFFASDLTSDEICHINKIYSRGKYIDKCIEEVDKIKKTGREEIYRGAFGFIEDPNRENLAVAVTTKKTNDEILKADTLADVMISFAVEAAKEIADADGWTGYHKLLQIAKLK